MKGDFFLEDVVWITLYRVFQAVVNTRVFVITAIERYYRVLTKR